jgi:hypothetical protein
MDDIRILAFTNTYDYIFYGIILAIMALFLIEIVLSSIAKNDYFFSFFFWSDIVCFLSLIPDCGWIWQPIIGLPTSYSSNPTKMA